MIKVENLTDDAYQEHVILFEQFEILLTLRYFSTVQKWAFNVSYKSFFRVGTKLAINTLHMESANQPFDFIVVDESGFDLDPFALNDWSKGRCSLYILERADMKAIRGVDVPL